MAQVDTVFVYADGQIGLRKLETCYAGLPVYRVPVVTPISFAAAFDQTVMPCFTTEDYTRKGRMYEGRPVFCADGFDLRELGANWFVSELERARGVADEARYQAERHMMTLAPSAIVLDQRIESEPVEGQYVVEYRARRLVAEKAAA